MQKKIIIIAGPTAIGKTQMAIQLAQLFDCEIISADSRQVYQEMTIGTAKPSPEILKNVKHHFINHISVHQPYNAGIFESECNVLLENYFKKKDIIIVCGGTGLYIDAICNGMDHIPEVSNEVRTKIQQLLVDEGIEFLQNELKNWDEEYYYQIDIQNPRRLTRALEVIYQTQKPFSSFLSYKKQHKNFDTIKIVLEIPRQQLYSQINHRVDAMMQQNLLEEVKSLLPYRNLKALDTVGYKEFFDYFDQKTILEEAIELVKQHTRNYAKRQITWFKKDEAYTAFSPQDYTEIVHFIKKQIHA